MVARPHHQARAGQAGWRTLPACVAGPGQALADGVHTCPAYIAGAASPPCLPRSCSPNSASEEKLAARKAALLQQREELSQRFEQAQARLMEARAAEDAKGGVPGEACKSWLRRWPSPPHLLLPSEAFHSVQQ